MGMSAVLSVPSLLKWPCQTYEKANELGGIDFKSIIRKSNTNYHSAICSSVAGVGSIRHGPRIEADTSFGISERSAGSILTDILWNVYHLSAFHSSPVGNTYAGTLQGAMQEGTESGPWCFVYAVTDVTLAAEGQ
jgi:hypothetical protein